jgi:hypothetical protein
LRFKMHPKGDRWVEIIVHIGLREIRSGRHWECCRHDERVVPFGLCESASVYFGHQERILMNVERMVRKGAVEDRPLFVISRNHIVE